MKPIRLAGTVLALASLAACSGTDYLADVTKDSHSGCFSATTNYMGFTNSVNYVHLGDNAVAINASPACSGVSTTPNGMIPQQQQIPTNPTLVK